MTRQPRRRELLTVATLGAVCPGAVAASETLTWRRLPDLPQTLGGQFAGVHNGALIVAGGSHCPQSKWTGGVKKWVDSVFVLTGVEGSWRTFRLPAPLAYGGSVSTADGLLLIGGGDAEKNSREVLRLRWTGTRIEVSRGPLLPVALANCVAVRIGGKAWLVGGQESPTATATSRALFSLDLNDAKAGWRREAPIPGPGRILPAAAAVGAKLLVASGADLYADSDGKPARRYLRDAWCFTPGKGWAQLPDMPRVACAAPAMGAGDDFLVFGGSDGILAPREMELRDAHPGFCKDLLVLRTGARAWSRAAELPAGIVTTTAALWDGMMVIPGGEDRPAHRSAAVFGYRYQPPASL